MAKRKWIEPIYEYTFHLKPTFVVRTSRNIAQHSSFSNSSSFTTGIKQENETKGIMSPEAIKKLKSAILWLVYSAEWKKFWHEADQRFYNYQLTFVTLTLPTQNEKTDQEVKAMMNGFLMSAKYAFGLKNYCWRAEPQRRGTAHIHLTADCFMHWKKLRYLWNRQLKKADLMNGHSNPNSTDIHSLKSVANIVGYLIKYYTKQVGERRAMNGRLWGCSHALTQARHLKVSGIESDGHALQKELLPQLIYEEQKDFFTMYNMKNEWFKHIPEGVIKKAMRETMEGIRYTKTTQEIDLL